MHLVNGKVGELSILDRGLAYGDGVFETIRVANGEPQLFKEHLERLEAACRKLEINITREFIEREALDLCAQSPQDNVLKIIVTRGDGRAYRYGEPGEMNANRILITDYSEPWSPSCYADGVRVRVCDYQLSDNAYLAGIKHLNRLDQVIARAEWRDEYDEGLMLDARGYLIEGTMTNVLLRYGKTISTPTLKFAGVAGVMRAYALKLARARNLKTEEANITLERLLEADRMWICNSLIGICPVRSVSDYELAVEPYDKEDMYCVAA